MNTNMEKFKNTLKSQGIRPTYQRLKILKYLKDHRTHPTIDMIYEHLVKTMPTISKTTVYNTLNTLWEKGLAKPVFITAPEIRYDDNTSSHHHFLCESCGKILDLDITCQYFEKRKIGGHRIKELYGYFKGICQDCLKKRGEKEE